MAHTHRATKTETDRDALQAARLIVSRRLTHCADANTRAKLVRMIREIDRRLDPFAAIVRLAQPRAQVLRYAR